MSNLCRNCRVRASAPKGYIEPFIISRRLCYECHLLLFRTDLRRIFMDNYETIHEKPFIQHTLFNTDF